MLFHPRQAFDSEIRNSNWKSRIRTTTDSKVIPPGSSAAKSLLKADFEEVELVNAINLKILKEFQCYKYSYTFTPEISFDLKWKLFSLLDGCLFDKDYFYLPRKEIEDNWTKWFMVNEFEYLDVDLLLEVNFIEEISDRKFIIEELLIKTSKILKETYFSAISSNESCEELLLNTFPGVVIDIREIDDDNFKSLAVLTLVSKQTIAISNVYDRVLVFKQSREFRRLFNKNLLKRKIISKHTGKTYFIEEIKPEIIATTVINQKDDEKEETYKSFFEEFFGLKTEYDDQPILFCKERQDSRMLIALLPEFCDLVEEDIDFPTSESICREKFYKFVKLSCQDANVSKMFSAWGFQFSSEHCSMSLKNFDIGVIKKGFKASPSMPQFMNTEWFSKTWHRFYRQPFAKPIDDAFSCWGLITPPIRSCRQILEGLFASVQAISKETNIPIAMPNQQALPLNPTAQTYIDHIEALYYQYGIKFVVVIMSGICRDNDTYTVMKKYCTAIDIALQVVMLPTLDCAEFFRNDIVANIFSQINCKMGGIPWAIEMPFDHVMFVGIHLYEDVLAFSANTQPNSEAWLFETRALEDPSVHAQSLILGNFIMQASKKYFEKNSRFPMQVVVIRNFDDCTDRELISNCIASDIEIVSLSLRQLILQDSFAKMSFVDPEDLISDFFYLEISDHCDWPVPDDPSQGMDMTLSLMTPYFTMKSVFPAIVHVSHPKNMEFSSVKSRRIQSLQDLQLSLIIQSHLYFNSATFSPLPAVCINARKLAIYSKKIVGQNIYASENFSFL